MLKAGPSLIEPLHTAESIKVTIKPITAVSADPKAEQKLRGNLADVQNLHQKWVQQASTRRKAGRLVEVYELPFDTHNHKQMAYAKEMAQLGGTSGIGSSYYA